MPSLCLLHLQRLDFGLLTVCRCCRRQPRDPIRKHAAGKMTDSDLDTCACFFNQKKHKHFFGISLIIVIDWTARKRP